MQWPGGTARGQPQTLEDRARDSIFTMTVYCTLLRLTHWQRAEPAPARAIIEQSEVGNLTKESSRTKRWHKGMDRRVHCQILNFRGPSPCDGWLLLAGTRPINRSYSLALRK